MTHRGRRIDPRQITRVALMTVEGENDDISGVGQTEAAHRLCVNIPADNKVHYLQPDVGHYGVFNGSRFRAEIAPRIADFALSHNGRRAPRARATAGLLSLPLAAAVARRLAALVIRFWTGHVTRAARSAFPPHRRAADAHRRIRRRGLCRAAAPPRAGAPLYAAHPCRHAATSCSPCRRAAACKAARAFAQKHGGWIAARLDRLPQPAPFARRHACAAARRASTASCIGRARAARSGSRSATTASACSASPATRAHVAAPDRAIFSSARPSAISKRRAARAAGALGVTHQARVDPRPVEPLGLVLDHRRAVVFLAAHSRAAFRARLSRRARGRASGRDEPLARVLAAGRAHLPATWRRAKAWLDAHGADLHRYGLARLAAHPAQAGIQVIPGFVATDPACAGMSGVCGTAHWRLQGAWLGRGHAASRHFRAHRVARCAERSRPAHDRHVSAVAARYRAASSARRRRRCSSPSRPISSASRVGQIVYGPVSDRHGRKPVLLGALALYCAASLVCALSTSIEMLIGARALQALGGSRRHRAGARHRARPLFRRARRPRIVADRLGDGAGAGARADRRRRVADRVRLALDLRHAGGRRALRHRHRLAAAAGDAWRSARRSRSRSSSMLRVLSHRRAQSAPISPISGSAPPAMPGCSPGFPARPSCCRIFTGCRRSRSASPSRSARSAT